MTTRTRTNKKLNARLEGLEAREAPAVGFAGAWQAALAQAQSHSLRSGGFQSVQRALPLARPGSTHQGPQINSAAVLVQTCGAAMNTPALMLRAPIFNRAPFQSVQAARSFMRAPAIATPPPPTPVTPMPTSNTPPVNPTADADTPPQSLPPNVSGPLNAIYQEYQRSSTVPVSDGPGAVVTDGSNVGVSVHGNGQGSFSDFVSTFQNLGMQISATSDVTWTIAGMLPIKELPAAAQTPQTRSITPMYRPVTFT